MVSRPDLRVVGDDNTLVDVGPRKFPSVPVANRCHDPMRRQWFNRTSQSAGWMMDPSPDSHSIEEHEGIRSLLPYAVQRIPQNITATARTP